MCAFLKPFLCKTPRLSLYDFLCGTVFGGIELAWVL